MVGEPVAAPVVAPVAPPGGLRVLHSRLSKGKRPMPQHVSATWLDSGLQLMVTGLEGPCAPAPTFTMVAVADTVRLVETPADAEDPSCTGYHTLMMQIDGMTARDLTVEVVRGDGEAFGSAEVKSTDH